MHFLLSVMVYKHETRDIGIEKKKVFRLQGHIRKLRLILPRRTFEVIWNLCITPSLQSEYKFPANENAILLIIFKSILANERRLIQITQKHRVPDDGGS